MTNTLSESEAAAMLCLLLVSADDNIKQEELAVMLSSPFFEKHMTDKIGPHQEFIQKYLQAKKKIGADGLEKLAVSVLSKAFPAFQVKTLALMTLIAEADGNYDDQEKELITHVAKTLKLSMDEIEEQLNKMKEARTNQEEEDKKKDKKNNKETPPAKEDTQAVEAQAKDETPPASEELREEDRPAEDGTPAEEAASTKAAEEKKETE